MNIFNKVALATLKKNKTRTTVTIIGIILSAAMICAVTTSVKSLQSYLLKQFIYSDGAWHGAALNTDEVMLQSIKNSDRIKDTVWSSPLGYAMVDTTNELKPYLHIIGTSVGFEDMMSIHLTEGNYPQNDSEIILPLHYINDSTETVRIGDAVTYDIGRRTLNGEELGQHDYYYAFIREDGTDDENESFEVMYSRTYTVVGFYERPGFEYANAPGYTAITFLNENTDKNAGFNVYFTMNKAKDVYAFMADNYIERDGEHGRTNSDVLTYMGVSESDVFNRLMYGFATILICLIMVGSISLIYNAFSISVSERTKQFGLLSSIGATRKQLSKMVFFEALTVSVIGIPLGVIAGIGGIGVTLSLLGDKFSSFGGNTSIPMQVSVSYASIGVAAVIALVTVLISAWIPSRRATRICAVEAIRQSTDIQVRGKNIKTSRLTYKIFGLPGTLAKKYFKRSRKKYRTTVMSLFMSIVLFISAAAFSQYFMWSVSGAKNTYGFDIMASFECDKSMADSIIAEVRDEKTVTKAAYAVEYITQMSVPISDLTQEWLTNVSHYEGQGEVYDYLGTYVCFIDDHEYRKFLRENGIDEDLYMSSDEPLAVAIDGQPYFSYNDQKYYEYNVLKNRSCEMQMTYSNDNFTQTVTHKVGTVVYENPFFAGGGMELTLLYPNSAMKTLIPEDRRHNGYSMYVCSSNYVISGDKTEEILKSVNLEYGIYNYAEQVQAMRDLVMIVRVFSYGFIALISLIAAANVFNTISTNINLRRREFAVLKSVGMTNGDFNKMMNYECLLYGTKSLLYGLPVSFVITYLIHKMLSGGYEMPFIIPWTAVGISVLSVFAVVFVTMMYSMRKIKKDNPIDALKNENL